MKIRSETRALLAVLAGYEFPVPIKQVAADHGYLANSLRRSLTALADAGYVRYEIRRIPIKSAHGGWTTERYFWIASAGQELISKNPPPVSRVPRGVVNSVFALGSNALVANLT